MNPLQPDTVSQAGIVLREGTPEEIAEMEGGAGIVVAAIAPPTVPAGSQEPRE